MTPTHPDAPEAKPDPNCPVCKGKGEFEAFTGLEPCPCDAYVKAIPARRRSLPIGPAGGTQVMSPEAMRVAAETAYWEAVARYEKTGKNMDEVWKAFDEWNEACRRADPATGHPPPHHSADQGRREESK